MSSKEGRAGGSAAGFGRVVTRLQMRGLGVSIAVFGPCPTGFPPGRPQASPSTRWAPGFRLVRPA